MAGNEKLLLYNYTLIIRHITWYMSGPQTLTDDRLTTSKILQVVLTQHPAVVDKRAHCVKTHL